MSHPPARPSQHTFALLVQQQAPSLIAFCIFSSLLFRVIEHYFAVCFVIESNWIATQLRSAGGAAKGVAAARRTIRT